MITDVLRFQKREFSSIETSVNCELLTPKLIEIPTDYKEFEAERDNIVKYLRSTIGELVLLEPNLCGPPYKDCHETRLSLGLLQKAECYPIMHCEKYPAIETNISLKNAYDLHYGIRKAGSLVLPPLFTFYGSDGGSLIRYRYIAVGIEPIIQLLQMNEPLYELHIKWLKQNNLGKKQANDYLKETEGRNEKQKYLKNRRRITKRL